MRVFIDGVDLVMLWKVHMLIVCWWGRRCPSCAPFAKIIGCEGVVLSYQRITLRLSHFMVLEVRSKAVKSHGLVVEGEVDDGVPR